MSNQGKLYEAKNVPRTITLILPDNVMQPVQRVAQATKQSIEIRSSNAVAAILPLAAKVEVANANPPFGNNDKFSFRIRFYN